MLLHKMRDRQTLVKSGKMSTRRRRIVSGTDDYLMGHSDTIIIIKVSGTSL